MSAQFSKGDRVEIIGSADEGLGAGFPVGGTGTVHTLHLFPDDGMVYVRLDGEDAMHAWFPPANLRKVEPATEPEDKDDLYVEPEPLADWERALLDEVDSENTVTINTLDREEIHRFIACLPADWGLIDERDGSTLSETVDQVIEALREFANPKPARCTSLVMADKTTNLRQCVRPEDGHDEHAAYGVVWTDAEAYGRVEVVS